MLPAKPRVVPTTANVGKITWEALWAEFSSRGMPSPFSAVLIPIGSAAGVASGFIASLVT